MILIPPRRDDRLLQVSGATSLRYSRYFEELATAVNQVAALESTVAALEARILILEGLHP